MELFLNCQLKEFEVFILRLCVFSALARLGTTWSCGVLDKPLSPWYGHHSTINQIMLSYVTSKGPLVTKPTRIKLTFSRNSLDMFMRNSYCFKTNLLQYGSSHLQEVWDPHIWLSHAQKKLWTCVGPQRKKKNKSSIFRNLNFLPKCLKVATQKIHISMVSEMSLGTS